MDTQYQKIKSITLKQLLYAQAAANHGNVTAAARSLNISQPSISAAISALESHYGMKLFTRQPAQGVTPTPFGLKLMAEARLLMDQALTVATLAEADRTIAGTVTISCYEALAPHLLPRLLQRMRKRLPHVTIRFQETDLQGAIDALSKGSSDLAVTYDLGMHDDFLTETLYSLQPRILCGPRHRFAERRQIDLIELHGEDLILLDQPLSAQYVLGLLRAKSAVPKVVAQVRSMELQRSLVSSGFGIALVHTAPDPGTADILSLAVSNPLIEQRVLVARLRQSARRPILNAVQSELTATFAAPD